MSAPPGTPDLRLPDGRKLVDECVHCGFCLPSCPTYRTGGQEADSPRGRIALMKSISEGRLALTDDTARHFDQCLGCLGCVTACPSGVKYDALIEATRAARERTLPRPVGDRLFRSLLFALFPHPGRLRLMLVFQLAYHLLGIRWLVRRLGLLRLLPARLRQLEALLPPAALSMLWSRVPPRTAPEGPPRARVAVVLGCVQRVHFPEVNAATVRVLAAEGCEVVAPPDLGCCGALSLHAGREDEARELARKAITAIERAGVDAVIVNSAGCGSAMKDWGKPTCHLFEGDPDLSQRARAVAAKVADVSEYLSRRPAQKTRHALALKVAYHDACHLAHAQRIRAEPRALLAAIPGLTICEIPDGEQCCGSAGIYNLVEPESARAIGQRKLDNVLPLDADVVCSANPGCSIQLGALARERGRALRLAHPIELLDASIRGVDWPER